MHRWRYRRVQWYDSLTLSICVALVVCGYLGFRIHLRFKYNVLGTHISHFGCLGERQNMVLVALKSSFDWIRYRDASPVSVNPLRHRSPLHTSYVDRSMNVLLLPPF